MKITLQILTIVSAFIVVLIFLFLGYFSLPLLVKDGLFNLMISNWNPDKSYGLLPMILGSLSISLLASFFAFLYSISIALSVDGMNNKKIKDIVIYFFNILSSIPTVIYGFLGVIILVPIVRDFLNGSGMNLFSASLMLSLVITPTMVLFFADTFKNTPKQYSSIVNSLGGDIVDYQIKILLPYSLKSITIGFVMGFSRAIGDTMIALMVAGNSIVVPTSLSDSIRTLTSHIALLFAGDFDSMEFKSIFASGFILFIVSSCLLFFIHFLKNRYVK